MAGGGHGHDPSCDLAHGAVTTARIPGRVLVAVYASPLAAVLLRWAGELGFTTVLVEPRSTEVDGDPHPAADHVVTDPAASGADATADVVVTDHHREDLGAVMAPLLASAPRWIGIIGSPRHPAPLHVEGAFVSLVMQPPLAGWRSPSDPAVRAGAGLTGRCHLRRPLARGRSHGRLAVRRLRLPGHSGAAARRSVQG